MEERTVGVSQGKRARTGGAASKGKARAGGQAGAAEEEEEEEELGDDDTSDEDDDESGDEEDWAPDFDPVKVDDLRTEVRPDGGARQRLAARAHSAPAQATSPPARPPALHPRSTHAGARRG